MWFDCEFPGPEGARDDRTILSTSPEKDDTHWHQTVVLLPDRCVCVYVSHECVCARACLCGWVGVAGWVVGRVDGYGCTGVCLGACARV